MALTDAAVKAAKPKPGDDGKPLKNKLADGKGLYLIVKPNGSKEWFFLFPWGGKRPEMSLGSYPDVSLADARLARAAAQDLLDDNRNPLTERKAAKALRHAIDPNITFAKFAEEHMSKLTGAEQKTRDQFLSMTRRFVGDLGKLPPAAITRFHVADALEPYWKSRPYTARKMRQFMFKALVLAQVHGLIPEPWSNPASPEMVKAMLGNQDAKSHKRRPSLDYQKAPAFLAQVREVKTVWSFAAEFCILTCARSKEARLLMPREVDFEAKVWTIPAARMKMRIAHRVPLSDPAIDLLRRLGVDKMRPGRYVFLNPWTKEPIAGDAITDVITELAGRDIEGAPKASLHGFRRTFRNWSKHSPNYRREFAELCLAHRLGSDVEHAYWDDDALEERRLLMADWGAFLSDTVVPFKGRQAA